MIRVSMGEEVAGGRAFGTALDEEGFDDLGSGRLIESFARHFMVALDAWYEHGFGEAAKKYLARLSKKGLRRDIAENGDLMLRLGTSPTFPTRGGNWRFHSKKRQKRESDQGNSSEKPA